MTPKSICDPVMCPHAKVTGLSLAGESEDAPVSSFVLHLAVACQGPPMKFALTAKDALWLRDRITDSFAQFPHLLPKE